MPSLFIKDSETADLAAELATIRGVTKTVAVRDALKEARLAYKPKRKSAEHLIAWLDQYQSEHPLPPHTGLPADKAFYDWLSGEEDVPDVIAE